MVRVRKEINTQIIRIHKYSKTQIETVISVAAIVLHLWLIRCCWLVTTHSRAIKTKRGFGFVCVHTATH